MNSDPKSRQDNGSNKSQLNNKKTRLYNSRTIRTQNVDPAYNKDESKLDVAKFIQSRKYEINAFELSQLKSKSALSTRCFQNLPRIMRRRAASHNVKRIPKRLRAKAIKEMSGATTNTPKHLPKGRVLFKIMQKQRILKAASKLKNDKYELDPVLKQGNVRAAIKKLAKELRYLKNKRTPTMNNSVGSIDRTGKGLLAPTPAGNIKYRNRQRDFAWTPTHIWHAKRFKMSKQYGFQIPYTPTQKCFKFMNRQNRYKSVCFDTSYTSSMVLRTRSVGGTTGGQNLTLTLQELLNKRKVPSMIANGEKCYIGGIYMKGKEVSPGLIYANLQKNVILVRVHASVYVDLFENIRTMTMEEGEDNKFSNIEVEDCRFSLGSIDVSGPRSLNSLSKIFHLKDVSEELKNIWTSLANQRESSIIPVGTVLVFSIYDPRLWNKPTKLPFKSSNDLYDVVLKLKTNSLVDYKVIENLLTSTGRQASYRDQLSIKDLGKIKRLNTEFSKISHSTIPILLVKTEAQYWSLICPWFWVLPIWIQIVKIPDIKPGGLKQLHQFQFEKGKPFFPNDFPWNIQGWKYNNVNGELARESDMKKPKNQVSLKQSEGPFTQILDAYKADWFALRNLTYLVKYRDQTLLTLEGSGVPYSGTHERQLESMTDVIAMTCSLNKESEYIPYSVPIEKFDSSNEEHKKFLTNETMIEAIPMIVRMKLPVIQIELTIVTNGVILDNARIYSKEKVSDKYLVGFVTSGGMNLNIGKCSGVGAIIAIAPSDCKISNNTLFVRNPGKSSIYECKYKQV
ncbi:POP1 [Candida oxycetoniae]|uniref:POP1 n=1 Tax=Candida oxycetoniae TaxID=497107 RepID=A0AAI9SYJ3_9ASCO|nr:POP1 [Candida oxycetoniae]KAI3404855.2 POP1 [Candida oxycetoniae]